MTIDTDVLTTRRMTNSWAKNTKEALLSRKRLLSRQWLIVIMLHFLTIMFLQKIVVQRGLKILPVKYT